MDVEIGDEFHGSKTFALADKLAIAGMNVNINVDPPAGCKPAGGYWLLKKYR
jgi:hypothetical protein